VKRALLLLLVTGCDDPLSEAQRIESTRVLGARVESAGEPARAWPAPGEAASVSWLVADPRPAPPLGWAFSVCIGAPTIRGVPECEAPPFAEFRSLGIAPEVPAFSFTAPAEIATDRLIAQGVICADAEPVLAQPLEASSCAGDRTLALIEIGINRDGESNLNPTIRDEPVALDGAAWPEATPATLALSACSPADAAPELPVVKADGRDHEVAIELSPDDREPIERVEGADQEDLFVSHFSSAGRFEWPISVIDPGAELSVRVPFRAPGSIEGSGLAARVWLVVRDLRGGVDWTLRTVCFVP
jgi:hypothetical protein